MSMKNHRSGAQNKGSTHFKKIHLSESLVTSVLGADYATPFTRKQTRPASAFSGPKPRGLGATTAKGPDEMVLEVRRLSEQCGMTISSIAKHISSIGYKISESQVRNLLKYTTRCHLTPEPNHGPYMTAAA